MKILGWVLILFGSFWGLGRIQNQGEMYYGFLRNVQKGGLQLAIWRYLTTELLMGFGFGIFLLSLGYYVIYDFIPYRLAFGLLASLFYVLSCKIGYINITGGIRKTTQLSLFELKNPVAASITPLGHPFILVLVYTALGTLAFTF